MSVQRKAMMALSLNCFTLTVLFAAGTFGSARATASGFQVGAGGLTPHYFVGPGDKNYCHQIGESRIIENPTYFLRVEGKRDAFTAFVGEDSICSPIQGLLYSLKLYEGKWFGFNFTAGGYHFNMNNWIWEEETTPVGKTPVDPVYTKVGGNDYFVPVIGFELNFALLHEGKWSLWLDSLVTPIIANLSLSLKRTF